LSKVAQKVGGEMYKAAQSENSKAPNEQTQSEGEQPKEETK